MNTNFKFLILSATFFLPWGQGKGIAMDNVLKTVTMGQISQTVFDQQISKTKEYIANLDVAPNLVFGVSSTEEGIKRFDKSWIFVDIEEGKSSRDLKLDFNSIANMRMLAKAFPNTFQTIGFDAEVPTYIKGFGPAHLQAIHAALKMGGEFYLPWQYAMEKDGQNPEKWSDKTPTEALIAFAKENDLENRWDMLDPIVRLPSILGSGQNDELNQKIVKEIRDKNHLRVMQGIFGKENVEILQPRKLPFPENEGRLINPPYVDVFLAKKAFPTEDIPEQAVPKTPLGEVENVEEMPTKLLADQIQISKED